MAYFDTGGKIREIREARGLTQDQLAELASLNRVTVAKYESGRVEPGAKSLSKIADALEISTDVLLGRTEEMQEVSEKAPQTLEARSVSAGMDKLPKEQREMILNMVRAMFPNNFTEDDVDEP